MDLKDYEIRGRAVAQHFYDELEKIANLARSAGDIAQAMGRAGEETRRFREAVPMPWYNPRSWVGEKAQAYRAVKKRGQEAYSQAQKEMAQTRSAALRDVNSSDPATRQRALEWLEGAGKTKNISFGEPPPDPGMSPLARKAMMLGGAGVVGAGGLYAGQQYLNSQQGYGGY